MADIQKLSIRDMVLNADDIKKTVMKIPEWGDVEIELRGMTGAQRGSLLNRTAQNENKIDFVSMYPELIIACSYHPGTSYKVFKKEDRDPLNNKAGAVLEKLAAEIMALSGMGAAAAEAAEKN